MRKSLEPKVMSPDRPADVDADRIPGPDLDDLSEEDRQASRRLFSLRTVVGTHVRNAAGDNLGNLEEVVFDPSDGSIVYCAVSYGGFLGMGDKLFAVPWEALTYDTHSREFVINVDRELLEKAPGFDKDHWPGTADSTFVDALLQHFGCRSGGMRQAGEEVHR